MGKFFFRRLILRALLHLTFLLYCGCSLMTERSYDGPMSHREGATWLLPRRDFYVSQGDSDDSPDERVSEINEAQERAPAGFSSREKNLLASSGAVEDQIAQHKEQYQLEKELKSLEDHQPQELLDQYRHYQTSFRNISEQIYFLSLPANYALREQYLIGLGLLLPSDSMASTTDQWMDRSPAQQSSRQILNGMSERTVIFNLGTPLEVNTTARGKQFIYPGSVPYNKRAVYLVQGPSNSSDWVVQGWSEFRSAP